MPITRPVNLQKPFADTGAKNTIPVASQVGIVNGAASFTDGFPPLTMTPIAAGGVPPAGQDMNGILNILSQHTTFQNSGGKYRFDAALSTAIGGYPVGFVLQDDAGLNSYVNILAANTTNFNSTPASIGVSWIPYAGQAATQSSGAIVANGAGTADAITAVYAPAVPALTNGLVLFVRAGSANTSTTPTFSPNGLVAKTIVKGAGSALSASDIAGAGHWLELQYDLTLDKWVLQNPATGVSVTNAPVGQCKLSKSGANLVLSPFQGNKITINGVPQTIPAAGVSLAPTGLLATTLYYIYAYMVGAVVTLEAVTTTHAVDTNTGVEIKSGDATRTLVGMVYVKTAATFVDSSTQRFVRTWFNNRGIGGVSVLAANASQAVAAYAEIDGTLRNEFIVWLGETVSLALSGTTSNNGVGNSTYSSIGYDSVVSPEAGGNVGYSASASTGIPVGVTAQKLGAAEGYHYATGVGKPSVGTALWTGGVVPEAMQLTVRVF